MLDAIKPLLDSDLVNEETRSAIAEQWEAKMNETRTQVTAELREEFAQRYEHDKSTMVEALDRMVTEGLTTELEQIAEERKQITTEVLPQHLTFDETDVEVQGVRLKMNPPIRFAKDLQTLWKRLLDGTITCIATDHAPHLLEDKAKGWPDAPSGMPGVETSMPAMLTHAKDGRCTIEQVVAWMSSNVAEAYQMVGKGHLEVGYDGDIVVVDMENKITVDDANSWTTVGWNPFHGRELVGWSVLTVVAGTPVFERNDATGPKGQCLVEPGAVGKPLVMMPWN